jgi:hypothetical protein
VAAVEPERVEILRLVLLALAAQEVHVVLRQVRLTALARGHFHRQGGQVLALDPGIQVGRREGQPAVDDSHAAECSRAV